MALVELYPEPNRSQTGQHVPQIMASELNHESGSFLFKVEGTHRCPALPGRVKR
jgi:hypothetical protein